MAGEFVKVVIPREQQFDGANEEKLSSQETISHLFATQTQR